MGLKFTERPPPGRIRPALAGLVLQRLPEAEQRDGRGVRVRLEERLPGCAGVDAAVVAEPRLLKILYEVPDSFSAIAT